MVAAKRVLRYLKGTPDLCVRYSNDFTLYGYSDASHNSRSVSGYLYMLAGGPVTSSSKKQPVVALSSCESEYIALAYASQEAVHLPDLLSEVTFPQFSSVQMYEDNMVALPLSGATTAFSSRTKHIWKRYHFQRELVASNKIIVSHVMTTDQLADIFTKFLDYPKYNVILDKIINFASSAALQDQHFHHHLY